MATAKKLPSGHYRTLAWIKSEKRYKSFTAPTKKESEYLASLYSIQHSRPEASTLTVGEAIDRYIAAKDAVLSPATIRSYKTLRGNAYGLILQTRLCDLTQELVQSAINAYAGGRSPKTARNAMALLSASLSMFSVEPFRVTLAPRVRHDIGIPVHAEVQLLLKDCAGTPMETVLLLATSLGLRRSEICGLLWTDVDFASGRIQVRRAVVRNDANEWVTKTTKTSSGTRSIAAPAVVLNHLRGLVHASDHIVDLNPNSITTRYIRLRDRLGIRCRFHDLRHYHASLMLALNIPDKYAMERMGHATPGMLKTVYQHLMADKQQEVDATINGRLDELFKR